MLQNPDRLQSIGGAWKSRQGIRQEDVPLASSYERLGVALHMSVDRRQRLGKRSRKSDERCVAARAAVRGSLAGICAARVWAKGVFDRFGGSSDPKGTERQR